ncbi:pyridoxamine 5'-phosphate oxidase family protein [Phytohabitans sp. ZYX-F-186]|uniref:Pyridoxamine 5'-phosphate oxidase family protein n=1 Tax=Phytohabitans maris TaxID=3071409 RepID=A0ABU0ZBZ4_9ACTN|nr:pyridoxamine 5'-phosphate oxidase family protein [Phytohabitans sp. ZYX-F-186]MDQ7903954.1 pyridoxamine 5'-phosphate oxidase family protein [Phytohabitans sp. ZYX-F-186]
MKPVVEFDARYSSPGAAATPWADVLEEIARAEVFWLTTVRPDRRPHVTPLLAAWHGDALYFTTGAGERKAANLRGNDRVAVTTGANALRGLDVTLDGAATLVAEAAERAGAASAFEAKYGAHLTSPDGTWAGLGDTIREGGVQLYRVRPEVAFAFAKGGVYAQTRYRFV